MALKDRLRQLDVKIESPKTAQTDFGEKLVKLLSEKIASIPVWYDYDKETQFGLVKNFLDNKLGADFKGMQLSEEEKIQFVRDFLNSVHGFGPLDSIISKEVVSAVIVNASGTVFVECSGVVRTVNMKLSEKQLNDIKKRFVTNSAITNIRVDNLLVTIISQPVSENTLIIRKIKNTRENLSDLCEKHIVTKEIEEFLSYILRARKNIIISGNINVGKSEFLQILMNSLEEDRCAVLFEDFSQSAANDDAIMKFSTSSLNFNEFENLLASLVKLSPDYLISDINNANHFSAFYETLTPEMTGIITTVRGISEGAATSKFLNAMMTSQKCTEKQAKLRLSSQFDYIIHLDKFIDGSTRIASIMEITSTKSSALVQNEILKLEEDRYILDLPEIPANINQEKKDTLSVSFRSRLKSCLKNDNH